MGGGFNREGNLIHDKKFGLISDDKLYLVIVDSVEIRDGKVLKCEAYLADVEVMKFKEPFLGQKVWYDFENLDNFEARDAMITIHNIESGVM